jgi:transposase
MSSIAQQPMRRKVAIGVDTHKHIHVAVVLDDLGRRLGELTVPADSGGYVQLERWAVGFGRILAFGIEGTGSYGAGVASHLQRQGHRVIEVNRPDRRELRMNGKSDVLDAENAARAVLSGRATAMPKAADGEIEMLRQIKIAKDTAMMRARCGHGHPLAKSCSDRAAASAQATLVDAGPEAATQHAGILDA